MKPRYDAKGSDEEERRRVCDCTAVIPGARFLTEYHRDRKGFFTPGEMPCGVPDGACRKGKPEQARDPREDHWFGEQPKEFDKCRAEPGNTGTGRCVGSSRDGGKEPGACASCRHIPHQAENLFVPAVPERVP